MAFKTNDIIIYDMASEQGHLRVLGVTPSGNIVVRNISRPGETPYIIHAAEMFRYRKVEAQDGPRE
jgi:hypothetical protein